MERMKTCKYCGETLPVSFFPKKNRDRYRPYCRSCSRVNKQEKRQRKMGKNSQGKELNVELRGKTSNGKRYRYWISHEQAVRLVEGKAARFVHERAIEKIFTKEEFRQGIFDRDNYLCVYCGHRATTLDHIVPKSKGGLDTLENVVSSCETCNFTKKDLDFGDFNYYYDPDVEKPLTEEEYLNGLAVSLGNINVFLDILRLVHLKNITKSNGINEQVGILEERLKELTKAVREMYQGTDEN